MTHRVAISVVLQTSHCWKDAMLRGRQWPGDHSKGVGQYRVLWALEWATLSLQELTHGQFNLQGDPAVMRERPPVCVTDWKSLCDHLAAVGSPSTLHDKRSANDVLVMTARRAGRPQDYNWQTVQRKTRVRLSNVFVKV